MLFCYMSHFWTPDTPYPHPISFPKTQPPCTLVLFGRGLPTSRMTPSPAHPARLPALATRQASEWEAAQVPSGRVSRYSNLPLHLACRSHWHRHPAPREEELGAGEEAAGRAVRAVFLPVREEEETLQLFLCTWLLSTYHWNGPHPLSPCLIPRDHYSTFAFLGLSLSLSLCLFPSLSLSLSLY